MSLQTKMNITCGIIEAIRFYILRYSLFLLAKSNTISNTYYNEAETMG